MQSSNLTYNYLTPLNYFKNNITKKSIDEYNKKRKDISLKFKEIKNEKVAMLYYQIPSDEQKNQSDVSLTDLSDPIFWSKSLIIDTENNKVIASQGNKIIKNNDTIEYLRDCDWEKVTVYKSYEGTMIVIYYHNDKWNISTRRCFDANIKPWIKGQSFKSMFEDIIKDTQFKFDDLDKENCYHFILIHHENQNIVRYDKRYGDEYKKLIHMMTTKKYTMDEVIHKVPLLYKNSLGFDVIEPVKQCFFNNLEHMLSATNKLNHVSTKYKRITEEGFYIKAYQGKVNQSSFVNLKLQTKIYDEIFKMKPNQSNTYLVYLGLYQKNELKSYLQYFNSHYKKEISIIDIAFKNIASEILSLYHMTRQKNNQPMYSLLNTTYKKILYKLHGIYINKTQNNDYQPEIKKGDERKMFINQSVDIHDVYTYLKEIPLISLKNILYERRELIAKHSDTMLFLNKSSETKILTDLIYGTQK